MLKIGAAEINATPVLGREIPGYFNVRKATGVKSDLYTKAIVIDDGEKLAAIVAIDSLGGSFEMVKTARRLANEKTGIPEENILIQFTHAHTAAPVDLELYGTKADAEITYFTCSKAADAVLCAFNSRKEALIGSYRTDESTIAFNRRFYMRNGTVKMNPPFASPDIVKNEGPVDTAVEVIRIDDASDGSPIAVVTNFSCHLDCVGGTEYCGDYPSEMAKVIKRELGQGVVSLFLNGCCGDINHLDFKKPRSIGADHWRKMGRILAYDVLSAREKAETKEYGSFEAKHKYMRIDRREVTSDELNWAENKLKEENVTHMDKTYALDIIKLMGSVREPHNIPMQYITIGETGIFSVPGEVFTQIGLDIKAVSPHKHTMVTELGNGNIGYVASSLAHRNRLEAESFEMTTTAYETRISTYVDAVPETAELYVRTAKSLAEG